MDNNIVKLTEFSNISHTGAVKNDLGKLRYDLVPINALEELTKVLTFGAKKYADRNWEKGFKWGVVYAALMRHITAWWRGEDIDPESGLSHLSHAMCNIAFLIEFLNTHPEMDNRPKQIKEKQNV